MNVTLWIFYAFAAVLLAAGVRVVTAKNPVHAALYLVLCFFTAAAIWLLLYAEFLALTLLMVYVGAVMVLFLFVVMMLDINFDRLREGFWRHLPLAGGIGVVMALELVALLSRPDFSPGTYPSPPAGYSNTKVLGLILYTDYLLAFELAAVVLLVAMVSAIALTLRRRKETKYQNPSDQLSATKAGRLKILKMPPSGPDQPGAPQ